MRYIEKNNEVISAIELANKGQHEASKITLHKLSLNAPTNSYIKINLASLCFVLKAFDEVESYLDEFLSIKEQTYEEFYFIASELYTKIACYTKAIKCSENLTFYFPKISDAWAMLAQSSYAGRDTSKAIDAAIKTAELNPDNFEIKVFLAFLYSGKGLFDEAEKLYREVLVTQPGHSIACAGLSKCRKFSDDSQDIIALFDKALKVKGTEESEAQIRFSKAKIY
ncbi:MAG: tetratricopeptide (TPR) repeat protein, partial [Enterobacterales bacterium]